MRGEDGIDLGFVDASAQTSPRAWGRQCGKLVSHWRLTNLPACVGKTHSLVCMASFKHKPPRVRGEDPNREEPHFVRSQSLHRLLSLVSLTLYVSSTHEVPRLNGLMTTHISRGVRPKGQVRTVFTLPYMDQRYGSLIRVHHGPHLLFGEMHHYMLDWGLGRHDPACPRVVRFILR